MRASPARRAGTSFLELQVAMVVFGIAIAGLCPLVVMQSRLLRKIEWQATGSTNLQLIRGARIINGSAYPVAGPAAAPPPTFLQPPAEAWVRRFGTAASFLPESTVLSGSGSAQAFAASPSPAAPDDVPASFSAPSAWSTQAASTAVGGSYHFLAQGDTMTGPATWTLPAQVGPGNYQVSVSWVQDAQNATDASYAIVQGSNQTTLPAVDQTQAPAGSPASPFSPVGVYYLDSSCRITLEGSTTGRAVADAIQLVPVAPADNRVASVPYPPPPADGVVKVQVTVTPGAP